jgi:hypothetical protein
VKLLLKQRSFSDRILCGRVLTLFLPLSIINDAVAAAKLLSADYKQYQTVVIIICWLGATGASSHPVVARVGRVRGPCHGSGL